MRDINRGSMRSDRNMSEINSRPSLNNNEIRSIPTQMASLESPYLHQDSEVSDTSIRRLPTQ